MATYADLTRLMESARTRIPGALDNAIRYELFSVLDEFFRGSTVWREEIFFTAKPDRVLYDLEPEQATSLVHKLVYVLNIDDIPVRAWLTTPGRVAELKLETPPEKAQTYRAQVILNISDPTDDDGDPRFPRWVIETYRETILDGVLGRMMSQPAKPYASERLAIYHLRRFRDGTAQAHVDANRHYRRGAQAWRFPIGGWA